MSEATDSGALQAPAPATDAEQLPHLHGLVTAPRVVLYLRRASHCQSSRNIPVQILALDVLCYIVLYTVRAVED
jgi:hypothetical protein